MVTAIYPLNQFTRIHGVLICNNCGAFGRTREEVIHYRSCRMREGERWEAYYGEVDEIDEVIVIDKE